MSDTIREFLVKIGYQESGRREFSAGLKSVTAEAVELGLAIKGAALAVQAGVAVIASHLEQLYFLSQRSGATAESIQAIGYAASRVGSSVEAARGSLEQLGRFLWSNPGSENFINSLGVQTRTANGQLRDTGQLMGDLVRRIRQEQPAVQLAYARIFGIDENILRAPAGEADAKQARYSSMQRAAHYNVTQAAKDAHFFMDELSFLGAAIGTLQEKVASAFSRSMGEEISRFTTWLVNSFDKISGVIEYLARKVLEAGTILTNFGSGVWGLVKQMQEAWDQSDQGSKTFLKVLAGIGAAILVFDGIMSMSLVGKMALFAVALAGLILEYQAWEAGAKSIIPWEKWETEIRLGIAGIGQVKDHLMGLWDVITTKVAPAIAHLFNFAPTEGGFHNFLQDQIEKTTHDLNEFIDDISYSLEIAALIASGDFAGAWKLYKRGRSPTGGLGGVSPNDAGGLGGDAIYGTVAKMRAADGGGDLAYRLFQAPGVGENPIARFVDRAKREFRGEKPLGAGGGRALSNSTPQQQGMMQKAYDLLTNKYGYPPESAASLVGNFFEESGLNLGSEGDPNIPGGSGGIGQWNRERRDNFAKLFGHDVTKGTLEEQVAFAHWELTHTHKGVGDTLMKGGSTAAMSDAVLVGFEAPSAENQAKRRGGATATALLPQLRGGNFRAISSPRPERAYGDSDAIAAPLVAPLGVGPQSMNSNDNNSRQVAMNQTNNITVNASGDGQAIGRAVQQAQAGMAARTVRDLAARVG